MPINLLAAVTKNFNSNVRIQGVKQTVVAASCSFM